MLLALLPAALGFWWWWRNDHRWEKGKKRLILTMRAVIVLLLILSLARMGLLIPVQEQTVVFVVDRSASVHDEEKALEVIQNAVASKRVEDRFAVISAGAEPVVEQPMTTGSALTSLSAVINPHATDLAAALRLAGGLIPSDARGRVVLISDGEETQGEMVAAAQELRERGIRLDVLSLPVNHGEDVLLTGLDLPPRLYTGEKFDITVQAESTTTTKATLRLYEGNEQIGEQRVDVQKGKNRWRFSVQAKGTGFLRYRAEIEPKKDEVDANNRVYGFSQVEGAPSVLVLEGKKGEARNLVSALQASGVKVRISTPSTLPTELDAYKQYSSIVLANLPAHALSESQMERLHAAVRDLGIGLVMTGGENSFGMGGWFNTPVEKALPVQMELQDKKRIPSLGLVLVIDKSGSMEGRNIALAREAAVRSLQLLGSQDQVGVLGFDSDFSWVVPPGPVKDKNELESKILRMQANGGTNIYPAVEEAYEKIKELPTQRKHIILLSDGMSSQQENYEALIEKMKNEGITMSTVAVGQEADRRLLNRLAKLAGGSYYYTTDSSSIPTIFSKETIKATRSYIVEEPFRPKWVGGADWTHHLSGLPPLRAYVVTTPKQTAEVVLASPYPDPVLARWQYGLGRTVAWTSDLDGRWSKEWITWSSFPAFVNQVVGWTFPQTSSGQLQVDSIVEGNQARVEVFYNGESEDAPDSLELTVIDDQMKKRKIEAKVVAPGKYRAEFTVDEPGTYLLQATAGKKGKGATETFGLAVPYSPEYTLPTEGEQKMVRAAEVGGGTPLAKPTDAFADNLASQWANREIALLLLSIAASLWPFDVAVRRLSFSREPLAQVLGWLRRKDSKEKKESQPTHFSRLQKRAQEAIQERTNIKSEEVEGLLKQKQAIRESLFLTKEKITPPRPKTATEEKQQPKPKKEKKQESTPVDNPEETHISRLLAAKRRKK